MLERRIRILSGIISLTLIMGLVYFGVKVRAAGALKPKYQLNALFTAAGQGLQSQSDVKIHGINIGVVRNVKLKDGKALVRLDIKKGERVPAGSKATIRPKTLFGEKFVDIDPGDNETMGPFLSDEDYIEDTLGGFELEKILTELYPILKAVRPQELTTIIDTLATAGEGMGPAVNRQIANFATLSEVQARHDADFRLFLDDLARLSDELADRSSDVVGLAREANIALPPLNQRSDELAALLDQTSRLATDVADILEANESFFATAATEGGKPVQVLFDHQADIPKLVDGLRMFFQVLSEAGHIDVGDGTKYAAIKFIIGEECPEGRVHGCGPNSGSTATAGAETASSKKGTVPGPAVPLPPIDIESPFITPMPDPDADDRPGKKSLGELIEGLVR